MSSGWRFCHHWVHRKLSLWLAVLWRHVINMTIFLFELISECFVKHILFVFVIMVSKDQLHVLLLSRCCLDSLRPSDAYICVSKLSIIGSDNGLSPDRPQAIIWTNAGILLIGTLGTNFNEISIWIQTFSFKKMHLNMSSAKWRPFCLGLNVLIRIVLF